MNYRDVDRRPSEFRVYYVRKILNVIMRQKFHRINANIRLSITITKLLYLFTLIRRAAVQVLWLWYIRNA